MSNIFNIFFSPTGTTKKVGDEISKSFKKSREYKGINLTFKNINEVTLSKNDLALIGMPVYRGLLPDIALERFKMVRGNNTPAIIYVVYGNRHYDLALKQLRQQAILNGFIPVAEGTFIGEHSFSSDEYPIAKNRPDKEDLLVASDLGKSIPSNLNNIKNDIKDCVLIEKKPLFRIPPHIDLEKCNHCQKCFDICPTNAIKMVNDNIINDERSCITCMACLKFCPQRAREIINEDLINTIHSLYESMNERRKSKYKIFI